MFTCLFSDVIRKITDDSNKYPIFTRHVLKKWQEIVLLPKLSINIFLFLLAVKLFLIAAYAVLLTNHGCRKTIAHRLM